MRTRNAERAYCVGMSCSSPCSMQIHFPEVIQINDASESDNIGLSQSALEFCPIHCPNGRLGQDLGFGGIAFALKLPELLNRNLAAVRAKLGQRSCFPNGPQIWCPKEQ